MADNPFYDPFVHEIQADELAAVAGMDDDFPPPHDGFRTREEWERYNEEQDRRDRNKSLFGFKDY
jgi:hypothetical protein